ncbi:hypothetical protein [Trichormus sp. NMC-1]|uniref:hypothetical protein n=1 Tax=Trichormus sp. NMC-1 TaxID=1853259 RepID=UPI0008DBE944|nr:hypothetical protein [Trichormus sp. NMC-1]
MSSKLGWEGRDWGVGELGSWGEIMIYCTLFPAYLLPVPCSLFPVPYSLFPIPYSLFPVYELPKTGSFKQGKYYFWKLQLENTL